MKSLEKNLNKINTKQADSGIAKEPVLTPDQEEPIQPDLELENTEPAPDLDYRQHLEKLKSRDSSVKFAAYAEFENTREGLAVELGNLTDALLDSGEKKDRKENLNNNFKKLALKADRSKEDILELKNTANTLLVEKAKEDILNNNFKKLALKTGLSEKEIKEIYQDNEEAIIAEAKAEINKNTSKWKSAGLIAAKTTLYIGAGFAAATSTAATLGVGGLAGGGIIAGARLIDRLITEHVGKKKLDEKVKEIKASKGEKEKEALQDRLAAAISLKKKIEIGHVDLNAKGDRAKLIDDYIEEQSKAGKLGLGKQELIEYKDQIVRVMEGQDDIDNFNKEKEAKLNKKSFSDVLTKLEKKISGETSGERIASTAVLIGMGIAARELPVVRGILSAYAGYRFGGLAADYFTREKKEDIDPNGKIINQGQYEAARRQLLDKDFQKNSPREYLQLKEKVDKTENFLLSGGFKEFNASALNAGLDSKIEADKQANQDRKVARGAGRILGAVAGWVGGNLITDYFKHRSESAAAEKAAGSSVKSAETPVTPGAKTVNFEDKISNVGLKPGQHDSVWRSTEQIFKDHAQELGYPGKIKDVKALEIWAQMQTAKAVNNSGNLTNLVHESDKIILVKGADGYSVQVKADSGLTPGHLAEIGADNQAPTPEIPAAVPSEHIESLRPVPGHTYTLEETRAELGVTREPGDGIVHITPESQQQIHNLFGRLQKPGSVDINAFRKEFAALKGGPLNYQEESGIQDIIQNKNITQDPDSPLLREGFDKLVAQIYVAKGAVGGASLEQAVDSFTGHVPSEHIGSQVEIGKGTANTDPFASKHDPKLHYSKNVDQPVTKAGKGSGASEINKAGGDKTPEVAGAKSKVEVETPIGIKNADGVITLKNEHFASIGQSMKVQFHYDAAGNPTLVETPEDLKGTLGTEFYTKQHRTEIIDYWKNKGRERGEDLQLTMDKVTLEGRVLYKHLAIFDAISKNPSYGKEAESVKDLIIQQIKYLSKYGEVVDKDYVSFLLRGKL